VRPTNDFANLQHPVEKNEKFANRPPDPAKDVPAPPSPSARRTNSVSDYRVNGPKSATLAFRAASVIVTLS